MDFASQRSARRGRSDAEQRFYLVSADADCRVDEHWLWELLTAMESGKAAIGVCDYYYAPEHFTRRPRLWDAIQRTLRCRAVTFALFGGFPDGKGFAVERDAYEKVGGIEIFYQLQDGRFVNHLSDDWDFGIRVRSSGEDIAYVPRSRVEINPRRVNHAIDEVITGRAYGSDGIIVMRDIRVPDTTAGPGGRPHRGRGPPGVGVLRQGLHAEEHHPAGAADALPARRRRRRRVLRPLPRRAAWVAASPRSRTRCGWSTSPRSTRTRPRPTACTSSSPTRSSPGCAPPWARTSATRRHCPPCLQDVPPERFTEFVRYFCEDRESGEAHNYFGNGGVF